MKSASLRTSAKSFTPLPQVSASHQPPVACPSVAPPLLIKHSSKVNELNTMNTDKCAQVIVKWWGSPSWLELTIVGSPTDHTIKSKILLTSFKHSGENIKAYFKSFPWKISDHPVTTHRHPVHCCRHSFAVCEGSLVQIPPPYVPS